MKLTDLEPQFLRFELHEDTWTECDGHDANGNALNPHDAHGLREHHIYVHTIEEAHGVWFLCPKCFSANGGHIGTHAVICWSRSKGVPETATPGPGRWRLVGTGYSDLSLMEEPGKSRSVLLRGDCAWHGFITNGEVT